MIDDLSEDDFWNSEMMNDLSESDFISCEWGKSQNSHVVTAGSIKNIFEFSKKCITYHAKYNPHTEWAIVRNLLDRLQIYFG